MVTSTQETQTGWGSPKVGFGSSFFSISFSALLPAATLAPFLEQFRGTPGWPFPPGSWHLAPSLPARIAGRRGPTWWRSPGLNAASLLLGWRGHWHGFGARRVRPAGGAGQGALVVLSPAPPGSPRGNRHPAQGRALSRALSSPAQRLLPFPCSSCPHPPSSLLTGHLSLRCDLDQKTVVG